MSTELTDRSLKMFKTKALKEFSTVLKSLYGDHLDNLVSKKYLYKDCFFDDESYKKYKDDIDNYITEDEFEILTTTIFADVKNQHEKRVRQHSWISKYSRKAIEKKLLSSELYKNCNEQEEVLFQNLAKTFIEETTAKHTETSTIFYNFLSGKTEQTLEGLFTCGRCNYCSNIGADFSRMVSHLKQPTKKRKCEPFDVLLLS